MELARQVYHDRLRLLRTYVKATTRAKIHGHRKKNHLFCPVQTYNLHKMLTKLFFDMATYK